MAESEADAAIYARADVYHDFYVARGKDYAAEAAAVHDLVGEVGSLLDVACGTGVHLSHLREQIDRVEGVDISPQMLRLAATNVPGVPLMCCDMRKLRLDRLFEAVICMFSSIGYLLTREDLDVAVARLVAHLAPGGVIVVEPWWTPDTFLDGWVGADVVRTDERTISRVSHTVRDGDCSVMTVHLTVASATTGIETFDDRHRMRLFTVDQYLTAFDRAGADARVVEHELFGPGLLRATVR